MKRKSLTNNGFAHLGVILLVLMLVVIGGTGIYVYHSDHKTKSVSSDNSNSSTKATSTATNPYAGWKTHSDSNVSFMYPSDWKAGVGADHYVTVDDTTTSPGFTSSALTTADNPGAPATLSLQLSTDTTTVDCSDNPCTVASVTPLNNPQIPNSALAVVDQTSGNGTKYSQYVVVGDSTKVGDTVIKAVKAGGVGIYIFGQPYYTPKTNELTIAARVTDPTAFLADSHFKDLVNIINSAKFSNESVQSSWYLYNSPSGDFNMRIPDGWIIDQPGNGQAPILDQYAVDSSLAIRQGVKGIVTNKYPQHSNDYPPSLDIQWQSGPYSSSNTKIIVANIAPQGSQQLASLKTSSGLTIKKYYLYSSKPKTNSDEPIQGSTYTYVVVGSNSFLWAQYTVALNTPDYHTNLEQALETVTMN